MNIQASELDSACLSYLSKDPPALSSTEPNKVNDDFWFLSETQTVLKKQGIFISHRKNIATYGVSTSTAMVIITSRGRKYLAHVSPDQNLIDLIPKLEVDETATVWLFLGPKAITNPYLVKSVDLQIQDIVQEDSRLKLGLNSKFPYAVVRRDYGLKNNIRNNTRNKLDASSFDVLFTVEGLIYFKFKSSKTDLK